MVYTLHYRAGRDTITRRMEYPTMLQAKSAYDTMIKAAFPEVQLWSPDGQILLLHRSVEMLMAKEKEPAR